MLDFFLVVLCGLGFYMAAVCLVNLLYGYFQERTPSRPRVTVNSLRAWYDMNPSRYILHFEGVEVKMDNDERVFMVLSNFVEFLRYQWFLFKLDKMRQNKVCNEEMYKVLEVVQSDIDKVRDEISKGMEVVRKDVVNIQKNMTMDSVGTH